MTVVTKSVRLEDYIKYHKRLRIEQASLADQCCALCKRELPSTPELDAYVHLMQPSTFDFSKMRRNPSYFVDAALLIFTRYKHRSIFPEWVASAVVVQARNVARLLLTGTWESDSKVDSCSQFWHKLRQQKTENISVLLYLRKLRLLADGSAMSVEGFNSKLNHVMFDPHRRSLGSDHLEDSLRVVQNGSKPSDFKGIEVVPTWCEVFGHRHVMSRAKKTSTVAANNQDNAKRRNRYNKDAEYRTVTKKQAVDRWYHKKLILTMGRGLVKRPVRQSFKTKRRQLRGHDEFSSSSSSSSSSSATAPLATGIHHIVICILWSDHDFKFMTM